MADAGLEARVAHDGASDALQTAQQNGAPGFCRHIVEARTVGIIEPTKNPFYVYALSPRHFFVILRSPVDAHRSPTQVLWTESGDLSARDASWYKSNGTNRRSRSSLNLQRKG